MSRTMTPMNDIDKLRAALLDRRDRWPEIAQSANVSRKTLYRIASQSGYMPNMQTFLDLQRAIEAPRLGKPPEPIASAASGEAG